MTEGVEIFEVGPRDGLQSETDIISLQDKVALIDCLSDVGYRRIEVASFVNPKWVPQMADSDAVLAAIRRARGVRYTALTPNLPGFEAAMRAGADEVAVFGSASEGFSKANINVTIAESLARFAPVIDVAKAAGVRVRGYVSCISECPYDGPTLPGKVAQVAERLFEMGCYEISLGDTTGRATPDRIDAMLDAVTQVVPVTQLAGHYHDTSGGALENVGVSLDYGVRVFDASIGGLGGCPYAPDAAGNVATEALQAFLLSQGYETGLNLGALKEALNIVQRLRGPRSGWETGHV